MTYKVKLEIFEGPLDLLLFLIKKDEINIHDIPMAQVTEQYLQYMELMNMLDLNIAGEFLVMAATLMQIKSKLLLPRDEIDQTGTEEEDPRQELVRKLIEYKRFKEAASKLQVMEDESKDSFTRPSPEVVADEFESDADKYFEANIFDLISAFKKILKDIPKEAFYEVIKDEVSVSEKIHHILHLLVDKPVISFFSLFKLAKSKLEIVAIFLATLELIRMKEIIVRQDKHFLDIIILRNESKINHHDVSEEDSSGEDINNAQTEEVSRD